MNNQITLLIKKDKLLFSQMGGYMMLYAVAAVAMIAMIGSFTSFPILFSAILFTVGTCSTIVSEEEQSKCHLMAFTLPVSVKDYLKARYLYFFLYPIKMIFFCSLIGMCINFLTVPEARNLVLLLRYSYAFIYAIALILVFPAVFIPLYYLLGSSKSRIIFALIAFFSTIIVNPLIMSNADDLSMNSFIYATTILAIAMIAYYISYRISIKVIRKSHVF